jgi:hypothetical protein
MVQLQTGIAHSQRLRRRGVARASRVQALQCAAGICGAHAEHLTRTPPGNVLA